jgi:hypothetical protein
MSSIDKSVTLGMVLNIYLTSLLETFEEQWRVVPTNIYLPKPCPTLK